MEFIYKQLAREKLNLQGDDESQGILKKKTPTTDYTERSFLVACIGTLHFTE